MWKYAIGCLAMVIGLQPATAAEPVTNPQVAALFKEWRAFEASGKRDGAPDYTAQAMAAKHRKLADFQARLNAIDTTGWPIEHQVDLQLVRAEMNGLDFNIRVLKSWERDPAFYQSVWTAQSDTPAHEGPEHHNPIELWIYDYPLDKAAEAKLARELAIIPPLLQQARLNLTGTGRDLWLAGTKTMRNQDTALAALAERTKGSGKALATAIANARTATQQFVAWLEAEAPKKTGPSGIGKENYDWMLRHVHLSPLTWDDEMAILKRELARAHTALRLEEHRNRALPALYSAQSPEDYRTRALDSVARYMRFIEDKDILTVKPYMKPALEAHLGAYVEPEKQNFFDLAMHREPMTLWTHFYHWWDLAQVAADPHPSPIRSGPLLYNIWDSRSEGMATAMEEMMLHAGLYDDNPRVREIVWIMQAQRAARGIGSLYLHANMFTMKEASDYQVKWTPNGWMSPTLDLLGFEQQLYMRQPGYGSSYLTGKHQIEMLFAEYADQKGSAFSVRDFFDTMNDVGLIPVSLIRWQMTGKDDEIKAILAKD
jgi:hypothetical protein